MQEFHLPVGQVVEFAVDDSRAGRHHLYFARPQHFAVAHAVFVAQLARQGDRDDLHVVVRVRAETFPARHRVVVQHAQRTEMNPLRVVVIRKAECVERL